MSSNFPNGPDSIVNNVDNTTPEFDIHPPLHNQLADAIMAVEVSLLAGGSLSLGDHLAAADPHPVYLTQAEADARYPQLSATDPYPVYLTQPEGDARYLQLAGGTLSGNLLFSTDNLRDIGQSGALRPRTLYVGTSLVTPGWTNGTNFLANTDNTYNIGASGASRPRTIYAGTSVVTPGWTNGTNFLANTDNTYDIGASGANRPRHVYLAGNVILSQWLQVLPGWGLYDGASTITFDVTEVIRLNSGANLVEQRSGTNAQILRVYNTYTDASNYERLSFGFIGGYFTISPEQAGTGTARPFRVMASANGHLYLGGGAFANWQFAATGQIQPINDNAYDIGTPNRPRNIYAGSGHYLGNNTATQGGALFGGSGVPVVGLGANGDYYFRTDAVAAAGTRVYVKSAGAWVATAA